MDRWLTRGLVFGGLMVAAAFVTLQLQPTEFIASTKNKVELDRIVPDTFLNWHIDPDILPVIADPTVQKQLDSIYNDVLSRTYVNESGARIMLSIAYGGNQSDSMQVHKPETCYGAQGFQLKNKHNSMLETPSKSIPVVQMVAILGQRVEPITYWVKVGEDIPKTALKRKLLKIQYGLDGKIPDGVLVRVSSIGNPKQGYKLQNQFVNDLLSSLNKEQKAFLIGSS